MNQINLSEINKEVIDQLIHECNKGNVSVTIDIDDEIRLNNKCIKFYRESEDALFMDKGNKRFIVDDCIHAIDLLIILDTYNSYFLEKVLELKNI